MWITMTTAGPAVAVKRERLRRGRIVVYRPHQMDFEALDWWDDAVMKDLLDWSERHGPVRLLYDISHKGISLPFMVYNQRQTLSVGVTPEGKENVNRVLNARPTMYIRLAILLSDELSGAITYRRSEATPHPQIASEFFFVEEKALDWLRAK